MFLEALPIESRLGIFPVTRGKYSVFIRLALSQHGGRQRVLKLTQDSKHANYGK